MLNAHPLARYVLGLGYVGCAILWAGRLRESPSSRCLPSPGLHSLTPSSPPLPSSASVRTQPPLPLLLFLLCTFTTLTPTPLIEPRYFLTPWVILRILAAPAPPPSSPGPSKAARARAEDGDLRSRVLAIEAAWYVALNFVVLGVFLTVKFRWPSEGGWMRFMW